MYRLVGLSGRLLLLLLLYIDIYFSLSKIAHFQIKTAKEGKPNFNVSIH